MASFFNAKKRREGFLDIEDIKDGMIHLKGRRYRSVITADPVNFSLLSDEEQESVESAFGSMLMSFSFPVQFVINTKPVDMRDSIEELRSNMEMFPENMLEYEAELERFLSYFAGQVMITEAYMVIPYDDEAGNYERARGELMRRVQVAMEGLSRCGVTPRMLNTGELVQFMFSFFDRDNTIRIGDLIKNGALEFCRTGRDVHEEG